MAVIDSNKIAMVAKIPLDGHPESFQLETHGTRLFLNVPAGGEIEVFDRATRTLPTKWSLKDAAENFPMVLDEPDRLIFVGTRKPARMLVRDTEADKTVAILNARGDTDDIFYDPSSKRIYLSAGEECVDVFLQADSLA